MTQNAVIGCASINTFATASTTIFGPLTGINPLRAAATTESLGQAALRCGSVTLLNLTTRIVSVQTGASSVITVDKDTGGGPAASALTVTTTTGGATVSDITHTVSVSDTDKLTLSVANGAGSGNLQIASITIQLQGASQATIPIVDFGPETSTSSGFLSFGTFTSRQSTENIVISYALEAATLSNMQTVVSVNGGSGYQMTSRKNTATGNQVINVGSTVTGLFEDITHSDSLAAGDNYCTTVASNTVSRTINLVSMKYTGSTVSGAPTHCNTAQVLSSAQTRYSALWGPTMGATAESQFYSPLPFNATLSKLSANIGTNAATTGTTLNMRVAGANGNQTVSIGGSNGLLQDLTHTDSVNAGDLINYRASGSDGNVTFQWVGMFVVGPSSASGGAPTRTLMGAGK